MYIRRKVFSLGEGNIDYDYNLYQALYSDYEDVSYEDPIERFYSDSFDEGFDFYAQRMFSKGGKKNEEVETLKNQIQKLEDNVNFQAQKRGELLSDNIKLTQEKNAIEKAAEEAANKAKTKQEGLEKSLKRWKIGAGVGAGVAGLGLGAYLYNRKKDR